MLALHVNDILTQWGIEAREQYGDTADPIVNMETIFCNSLLIQTPREAKIRKDHCEVSGVWLKPKDRIGHHFFGRHHGHTQITIQPNIHDTFSLWQYKRDARWFEQGQPEQVECAFALISFGDFYELKSMKTGNQIYLLLAQKFTIRGSTLLRKDR